MLIVKANSLMVLIMSYRLDVIRNLLSIDYKKMLEGGEASDQLIEAISQIFPQHWVAAEGKLEGSGSALNIEVSLPAAEGAAKHRQILDIFKTTYPDDRALIAHYLGLDKWETEKERKLKL